MGRRVDVEPVAADAGVDEMSEWRLRWACRFGTDIARAVPSKAGVDVALRRIQADGRRTHAQRNASVDALLAEHGLLEQVERRLRSLRRARDRWRLGGLR